jgi:uroporphyrinogen decarboxylase
MKPMTKKERIDAAVQGQPVDRIPASFWRHFYESEDSPRGLADAMLSHQENFQWDFVKVNPRASYHHEDWGASYRFFKDGLTKPERLDYPVKRISDLGNIRPLEPLKSRVLKDHLDALHYIKKGLESKVYFLMTVFTPVSIVADLAGSREIFQEYVQEDPALVESAIEAVTLTFEAFVTELRNVGVSGLFFATTHWGTYDRFTDDQFNRFSRPYDMRILSLVKDCPFNVLHVCKKNNMLEKLADYPVHAFSWDTTAPSNPGLGKGKELLGRCVIGGIDHEKTMSLRTSMGCLAQANEALRQTGGIGWILGPGCTYSPGAPQSSLKALREWVEKVSAGR